MRTAMRNVRPACRSSVATTTWAPSAPASSSYSDNTAVWRRSAHAAAAPKCGPRVAPPSFGYAKGQVIDLAFWWRWGDSNSRPAASFQGFSERSLRLRFRPGLSGGNAPGS
jgi:hypothetical protein